MTIARVVPNVTGLDKTFDYLVPHDLSASVVVGDLVRVGLHGRRIGGWVVELDPADAHTDDLKPITKWSSLGPSAELVELSAWAAVRWAGRRRHFLQAASPPRNVARVPAERRTGSAVEPRSPASTRILADGGGVLRLPPSSDPMPAVLSAVALGPTLVIEPAVDHAMLLAARLRRSGLTVALVPDDWSSAAGGVDVVVGSRAAAWAPCPGLAAAVVIDEHDEALQEEGSPTWHARDVVIERCRRRGAPVLLVSPCPTLTAIEWGPLTRPPHDRERAGWPIVDVIDRSADEPWKRSLVTSELIRHLRDADRRVVCVSNTTGRAALLACRSCRELARCERCDAAVIQDDDERLVCLRCDAVRPSVCLRCGGRRFANLRPGVSRLREELEAAANRPAALVTGDGWDGPQDADVVVGTEAALHRVDRVDTVAFLDFDRELLSPRYRSGEQAMALLVRAARLVGPRARGGRVLVQTFLPQHDVVQAALLADPGRVVEGERERRRLLQLPPFGAYAEISGSGSDEFVASLPSDDDVLVVGRDGEYAARAERLDDVGRGVVGGRAPSGEPPPHRRGPPALTSEMSPDARPGVVVRHRLTSMAAGSTRRARLARKRRRRVAAADNDLTAVEWASLVEAWGGCAYCGATDTTLQRDCVLAISRGGRYTLDNVVPACRSCNASKCNDEVTGWLRRTRRDERTFLVRYAEIRAARSVDPVDD